MRPDAEMLCEHAWLKKNWVGHKVCRPRFFSQSTPLKYLQELRPQDSIPFLRRVSTDYQKSSDAMRYLSQLGENDVHEEQPISSSPPKHRHSASSQPHRQSASSQPSNSNSNNNSDISPRDHNFVKTTFSKRQWRRLSRSLGISDLIYSCSNDLSCLSPPRQKACRAVRSVQPYRSLQMCYQRATNL